MAASGGVDWTIHLLAGSQASRPRGQLAQDGSYINGGDGVPGHAFDRRGTDDIIDSTQAGNVCRYVHSCMVVAVSEVSGIRR